MLGEMFVSMLQRHPIHKASALPDVFDLDEPEVREPSGMSVVCLHPALDASTRSEFPSYFHRDRLTGGYQIAEDSIHGVFIENPQVPISGDVFL